MDATNNTPENELSLSLARQCFCECEAMAKYALASGLKVSGTLLQRIKSLELGLTDGGENRDTTLMRQLGECHMQLSRLIAPATPRTILLLASVPGESVVLRFLGPVPLIRQMMVVALLSLTALICLTLSPLVNGKEVSTDILLGSGMPLLLNELFLLAAAALGASFSALFMANRYIQEGTFDPKYNISYWIRFFLGVIAGFILATLINIDAITNGSTADSTHAFTRPLLSMIGGFSAAVVYRILNRIAESVESLFRGDMREQLKAQGETQRQRLQTELDQDRSLLAYRLMSLQQQLAAGATTPALQQELDSLLRELTSQEPAEVTPTPAPATNG